MYPNFNPILVTLSKMMSFHAIEVRTNHQKQKPRASVKTKMLKARNQAMCYRRPWCNAFLALSHFSSNVTEFHIFRRYLANELVNNALDGIGKPRPSLEGDQFAANHILRKLTLRQNVFTSLTLFKEDKTKLFSIVGIME